MNDNEIIVQVTGENGGEKIAKTPSEKPKTQKNTDSQKNISASEEIISKDVTDEEEKGKPKARRKTVKSTSASDEKLSQEAQTSKRTAKKKSEAAEELKDEPAADLQSHTSAITVLQENGEKTFSESGDGQKPASESEISEQTEQIQDNAPLLTVFTISSDDQPLTEELEDIDEENDTDEEAGRIIPPDELFAITKNETDGQEQSEAPAEEDDISTDYEDEDNVDDDGQYTFANLTTQSDTVEKASNNTQNYDPKKPRKIDGRFDIVELFVFTLLAVMIVTSFFFRHSIVKGESMENTLYEGEHLIISDFLYNPQRGDIIVCEDHTAEISTPIVKRVIAIGGDRIKITANGEVYVNGKLIDESDYVFIDSYAKPTYRYTPLEMTVPEGELFVMGDHRNNSTDSRDIVKLGTISEDAVLGKVLLRFYPFSKFGTVD